MVSVANSSRCPPPVAERCKGNVILLPSPDTTQQQEEICATRTGTKPHEMPLTVPSGGFGCGKKPSLRAGIPLGRPGRCKFLGNHKAAKGDPRRGRAARGRLGTAMLSARRRSSFGSNCPAQSIRRGQRRYLCEVEKKLSASFIHDNYSKLD